ncbi:alpha/beta fold hydrolase [Neobacillus niacini]|uniref:alpha/beta fold hydrolase n=1 Tax=Neobacillus niacini TaxID=86668 RepID=UPI0009DF6AA9|nr:alpha/beta fold hydrolase [Neobacillus niacini]
MDIVTTDLQVPHVSTVPANAGQLVHLFVRERDGTRHQKSRKAVLMIHGRSIPVLTGFDLGNGFYNWALSLAQAGFDVFMLDFQGSGRSPRPKMDDPCNVNPAQQSILIPTPLSALCTVKYPFHLTTSKSDWDELDTVVDYIRAYRNVEKVALIGWSAAAFAIGPYAIQHPDKVKSVLFNAPIFPPNGRPSMVGTRFGAPTGGFEFPMNLTTKADFESMWVKELKCYYQREYGIQEFVWRSIMKNDKIGRTWGPALPYGRPEGVLRYRNAFWWGWNSTTVKLDGTLGQSVPVLIIYGEHDSQVTQTTSSPFTTFSVTALYDAIPGARKLIFKVACAGHSMVWERQAKVLHYISKQWLKRGSVVGLTNGSFFVDTGGNLYPQ